MLKNTVLTTALIAAFASPMSTFAADDKELDKVQLQLTQIKESYEIRMQALEMRLKETETKSEQGAMPAKAPASRPVVAGANVFNPAIALNFSGTVSHLSQDPELYRLQGFVPNGGEIGPGARSFSVGESELTLSANIDPTFAGQLTFALAPDNTVGVEESFFQTNSVLNGSNLKVGRFLSSIGYQNNQHAHTWDFVDAPLAYQAFFGGQYKPDGAQFKWLAPLDRYLEIGVELGNGASFPGNDRNKNGLGARAVFAHMGDDIGNNASWRAGISYLSTKAQSRSFDDENQAGDGITNLFSGNSTTWIADAIFKWAPDGNSSQRNLKVQGEYIRRNESGTLAYDSLSANSLTGSYATRQFGWYLQGVYQFMPQWRVGLRHDSLSSGSPAIGLVSNGSLVMADFPALQSFNPKRHSVMLDYSNSEFSRFRLQFSRDNARPGVTDNQLFLQYNMSMGAHGAHTF
jgi:hypothetical protein